MLVFLDREQIAWDAGGAHPILATGLWPGVRAPPNVPGRGMEVATASREPWLDTNPYLIGYLRGMFPQRPAVLGYRPDKAAGISGGRAVCRTSPSRSRSWKRSWLAATVSYRFRTTSATHCCETTGTLYPLGSPSAGPPDFSRRTRKESGARIALASRPQPDHWPNPVRF